jgi:hypothetical protein
VSPACTAFGFTFKLDIRDFKLTPPGETTGVLGAESELLLLDPAPALKLLIRSPKLFAEGDFGPFAFSGVTESMVVLT